ncbi:hypothetical protein V8C86DRAFT_2623882 [Haematococcus lacustris]
MGAGSQPWVLHRAPQRQCQLGVGVVVQMAGTWTRARGAPAVVGMAGVTVRGRGLCLGRVRGRLPPGLAPDPCPGRARIPGPRGGGIRVHGRDVHTPAHTRGRAPHPEVLMREAITGIAAGTWGVAAIIEATGNPVEAMGLGPAHPLGRVRRARTPLNGPTPITVVEPTTPTTVAATSIPTTVGVAGEGMGEAVMGTVVLGMGMAGAGSAA